MFIFYLLHKKSHSCVEKAAMISMVKIRLLECDRDFSLRGETLDKAVKEDIAKGLIPFYVCGTFGTTGCCSFDNILELGEVCQNNNIYLHVDAAYAGFEINFCKYQFHLNSMSVKCYKFLKGNALICKELRNLMPGIEVN